MIKLYIREISCCLDCPHKKTVVYTHYCMFEDKGKPLDGIYKIPDWCQLEDVEVNNEND